MKDKKTKRDEAVVRNAAWAKLDPVHKLEYLDKMGIAAGKQRKKLAELMAK